METFGVGAVLNYGGYWLGFLTVLLLGIAAGFIGNYLARREKKKRDGNSYVYFSCVFIFFWLYICGWSFLVDSSWLGAVIFGLVMFALSILTSALCFDGSDGSPGFLVERKSGSCESYGVQIIVCVLAVIFFILVLASLSAFMAHSFD